jgi:hypothetical protein
VCPSVGPAPVLLCQGLCISCLPRPRRPLRRPRPRPWPFARPSPPSGQPGPCSLPWPRPSPSCAELQRTSFAPAGPGRARAATTERGTARAPAPPRPAPRAHRARPGRQTSAVSPHAPPLAGRGRRAKARTPQRRAARRPHSTPCPRVPWLETMAGARPIACAAAGPRPGLVCIHCISFAFRRDEGLLSRLFPSSALQLARDLRFGRVLSWAQWGRCEGASRGPPGQEGSAPRGRRAAELRECKAQQRGPPCQSRSP